MNLLNDKNHAEHLVPAFPPVSKKCVIIAISVMVS